MDLKMVNLMSSLWKTLVVDPCSETEKIVAVAAVLSVYCSLIGVIDDDMKDLMHQFASSYMGPSPEGESEFFLNFYSRHQDEH